MEDKLLEKFAEMLHKSCLSDLHNVTAQDLTSAVRHIQKEKYSLEDWNYALTYICKCKVALSTFEDIDHMMEHLK